MEKKKYMIPAIVAVEIKSKQQVLAGSMPYGGTTNATSGNLSREADDLWDE